MQAYKYCSERTPPLWDAMIYILGRMGHHKKALDLILTQMRDINQAIQFVQVGRFDCSTQREREWTSLTLGLRVETLGKR